MGQKLDKAPRGAYDAIVYIDGSEVVAEDSNGRKITSGLVGSTVADAAILHVYNGGGGIVAISGSHQWTTMPTMRRGVDIVGNNCRITLTADITAIEARNIQYLRVSGITIIPFASQTQPTIKLISTTNGENDGYVHNCFFENINILSATNQSFSAIQLYTDTTTGAWPTIIYNCKFDKFMVENVGTVVEIHAFGLNSGINMTNFTNFHVNNVITWIDMKKTLGIPTERCVFSDWGGECTARTTCCLTIANSSAYYCSFKNINGYDLVAGSLYYNIGTGNVGNVISRGILPGDTIHPERYTDLSYSSVESHTRYNPKALYNKKMVVVSADGSGDYTTLSAAYTAITDASDSNRYSILVIGKIAETTRTIAKSYIDVIGINAEIEVTGTGFFEGIIFGAVVNSTISGIKFSRIGTTYRAYAARIENNSSVVFNQCTFENECSGTTNSGAVTIVGPCSPVFRSCIFLGGYDTLGSDLGIRISDASTAKFFACDIYGNRGVGAGSAVEIWDTSAPVFEQCNIIAGVLSDGCVAVNLRADYGGPSAPKFYGGTIVGGLVGSKSYAFKSNGSNSCSMDRVLLKSLNADSHVIYIVSSTTMRECSIISYDPTKYAIYKSGASIYGTGFINCTIVGIVNGVTGIDGKSSGSSTGTGIEQTIAHGLSAIPTGCKAWIRYPISATVYAEKEVDMDATNIYPKVKTGLAYDWRVE